MRLFLQCMRPIAATVLLLGLWGCESDETEPPVTTFEIPNQTVNIEAAGGAGSVSYQCGNPVEGVMPQPTSTASWISDFDTSAAGTISFKVEENPDITQREAEVTVTYADCEASFTVVQAAADALKTFRISIDGLEASKVLVSVEPENKEMTYYLGAISAADLNTLPDDMTFVNDHLIPMFQKAATDLGISVEELMQAQLLKGDQTGQSILGLAAEKEYYVFCIGLNDKLEILSDFVKLAFTTEPLPAFEAAVEVEVNGPQASVLVTPANAEIVYFPVLFDNHVADNTQGMIAGAQGAIEEAIYIYINWYGMTREQAVAAVTKRGDQVLTYDLKAEAKYTAAVVAVSADGYVASKPATKEFTSGKTLESKNVVSVEYTNITGRGAKFIVRATEPEDPYVFFAYQYADSWKKLSDDEIIKYILELEKKDLKNRIRRGDVSTYMEALRQKTEYVVYAFGYSGGNVSTELFKSTFTTAEAQMNNVKFEYKYGPYYNGDEAAQKYPEQLASAAGKAVFPTEYIVPEKWYGIWHKMYAGDLTDKTKYPDEDVYQALRNGGGKTWMDMKTIYLGNYNEIYTLCGFVETEDGNFGEIYRKIVGPFTKEGCSPIEGLEIDFSAAKASYSPLAYRSDYGMQSVKATVKQADKPFSEVPQAAPHSDSKTLKSISIVETQGIAIHGCDPVK